MLFHIIAVLAVIVGIKGFTPGGLPVSNQIRLDGFWGKVVGGACLALAAAVELFWLFVVLANSPKPAA